MAQNTRARSANSDDRVGHAQEGSGPGQPDGQMDMFRELIQELRRDRQTRLQLPQQPVPTQIHQEVFKPPEYSGIGSVEVFIRQFLDVAEANEWGERTTVLHLRRALKEEARDCGGTSASLAEIFTALRARFGITSREARVRLNGARKEPSTSLQAHANRIKELVGIAYPELPEGIQEQMALDQFTNSLNQPRLQEHLLAIRPNNLTEAIAAGNEFVQIRNNQTKVRQVEVTSDERAEEETQVKPVQAPKDWPELQATQRPTQPSQPALAQPVSAPPAPGPSQPARPMTYPGQPAQIGQWGAVQPAQVQPNFMGCPPGTGGQMDTMTALMAAINQLAQGFSSLQQNLMNRSERKPPKCWLCGKEGHLQSRCRQQNKNQGNKEGQQ